MKINRMLKKLTIVLSLVLTFMLITPVDAQNLSANISGGVKLNLNSEDLEIGDVMTYDEMVMELIKNENMTKEEATVTLGARTKYCMMSNTTMSRTFRTISKRFTVTPSYKPEMNFYCETEEGYYFRAIVKILNVGMNRSYNGISKMFGGDVYVHLQSANKIFFIVNGDFFDNGTTTGGGNVNIGIDENLTIGFNISYSNNHYEYCYTDEAVYF